MVGEACVMLTTYDNDYAMLKTMVMRGYFVLSFKKMDENTSKKGLFLYYM